MSGDIDFKSVYGKGSTFTCTIPFEKTDGKNTRKKKIRSLMKIPKV